MKKIKLIMISILGVIISIIPLNAASFNMTSSAKQVSPNKTFTINVGGDCIGRVNLSVTNGTLSTSSVWVEMGYTSITVTAGSSGKVTVTATPVTGFSDSDANIYNPGSRTITVNISSGTNTSKPTIIATPKSNDNNLSSLTISNGELTPTFDKNQTEYKTNLKGDVTTIVVEAKSSDSKAKIEGIGEHSVHPGNNEISITVTAENGEKKTYKINAYVDETPEVYLDYKKEKIGIIRNYEGVQIPDDFTTTEQTIDDKKINIFTLENINLIYGINEENEKSFYLINKETNEIINKIEIININGKTLYIINEDKNSEITINETKIKCEKMTKSDNYYLINTINKNGEYIEYLYETTENGIIKQPEFLNTTNETKTKNIIIYILSALLLISISFIAYLIYKTKKGGNNETTK